MAIGAIRQADDLLRLKTLQRLNILREFPKEMRKILMPQ